MKNTTSLAKARLIAECAIDKKGENVVLMDMGAISTVCDWFVLVSASSSRRVNAISKAIQKELSRDKVPVLGTEGRNDQGWMLLDYGDVVVHIFHKDIRDFYGLERLWSEAPREPVKEKCLTKTPPRR